MVYRLSGGCCTNLGFVLLLPHRFANLWPGLTFIGKACRQTTSNKSLVATSFFLGHGQSTGTPPVMAWSDRARVVPELGWPTLKKMKSNTSWLGVLTSASRVTPRVAHELPHELRRVQCLSASHNATSAPDHPRVPHECLTSSMSAPECSHAHTSASWVACREASAVA